MTGSFSTKTGFSWTKPEPQEEVVDGEVVYEVVPWTGEALPVKDLATEHLAALLDECREFEYERLRSFKRSVQDEILARMDQGVEWTLHLDGGITVTGDSPSRVEYDVDRLQDTLDELIAEGKITNTAALKAVRVKTIVEPSVSGIKAILKLGGEVAERIEACQQPSSKPRAVRVSRKVA